MTVYDTASAISLASYDSGFQSMNFVLGTSFPRFIRTPPGCGKANSSRLTAKGLERYSDLGAGGMSSSVNNVDVRGYILCVQNPRLNDYIYSVKSVSKIEHKFKGCSLFSRTDLSD